MAMQTDILVADVSVSGTAFSGRTRVRGLLVSPGASAGSVVLKDGGSGGTTKMTIPTVANGEPFSVVIPSDGVLFQTDVYVAVSNTTVLVFHG